MSPRSNDSRGLPAKMVEYVLGDASPITKDLEARMRNLTTVSREYYLIKFCFQKQSLEFSLFLIPGGQRKK